MPQYHFRQRTVNQLKDYLVNQQDMGNITHIQVVSDGFIIHAGADLTDDELETIWYTLGPLNGSFSANS